MQNYASRVIKRRGRGQNPLSGGRMDIRPPGELFRDVTDGSKGDNAKIRQFYSNEFKL